MCFDTIVNIVDRKDDLEFWNINELLLEPCCALKYFPDIEVLRLLIGCYHRHLLLVPGL